MPRDAVIDEPVELMQGLNEFDEAGYTGPTAVDEDDEWLPHRYFFRLFALDAEVDLAPGAPARRDPTCGQRSRARYGRVGGHRMIRW